MLILYASSMFKSVISSRLSQDSYWPKSSEKTKGNVPGVYYIISVNGVTTLILFNFFGGGGGGGGLIPILTSWFFVYVVGRFD